MNRFYSTVFYRIWKRILTWIGDIMLATKPPEVKAKHLRQLQRVIRKGDIICRKYHYYFDSLFIAGEFSHSGLCISDEEMIHAIAEGVGKIDVLDFTKDTDGFIVLRPHYANEEELNKAVAYALSKEGMPYDFIFDKKEVNHFYCHELTWNSLMAGGINITPKKEVVYADDLIKACETIYRADT